ncbi:hypothetical protein GW17_00026990 [Ensete ventricosum]|nr:hypothetical protein GW17_00026990 [Ensete ventricosum]
MEGRWDFLEWLGPDASTAVLMLLDDPADLVRVSAVSQSWRQFEVGSSAVAELENLGREHRVYLYLGHCLGSPKGKRDCINQAICASSTDNFPDESIENTLEPSELVDGRPSYWSSGGQRNPGVPESLTYRLVANICIVEEIKIQPFRGLSLWHFILSIFFSQRLCFIGLFIQHFFSMVIPSTLPNLYVFGWAIPDQHMEKVLLSQMGVQVINHLLMTNIAGRILHQNFQWCR